MAGNNDRFVRWQGRLITQLGTVNNTVLVLTTASLGFAVSMKSPGSECALWLATVSLVMSVFLAVGCTLSRLWDFRLTLRVTRVNLDESKRENARRITACLGRVTWWLLHLQLVTFVAGALLLVVAA